MIRSPTKHIRGYMISKSVLLIDSRYNENMLHHAVHINSCFAQLVWH